MNVLGRELGERFDRFYREVAKTIQRPIEFKPLSSRHGVVPSLRGLTCTENDIKVVYLDTKLSDKQFELTAVHELCHQLLRAQGIGVEFRVAGIPQDLQQQAEQEAAEFLDCFTHIGVNRCMKNHGYDIDDYDKPYLGRLRRFIRGQQPVNQSGLALHTAGYISHIYRRKYGCPSTNVDEMTNLYMIWEPAIVQLAKKVIQQIPDIDFVSPIGCYQATKALRDALSRELAFDLSSRIKLKNPQTGQPE